MLGPIRAVLCSLPLLALACSSGSPADESEGQASRSEALEVGGCGCIESGSCADRSYSDVPVNGLYRFTTFGGPGGGTMSCGGVADGTWAYAAGRARFGCGAKLLIQKNGNRCVAQVADCGPNRCVEQAGCSCGCGDHVPTLAVSPLIAKHLIGVSSTGWSEQIEVAASIVDDSSTIGCPGVAVIAPGAGGSGAGGASGAGNGESGSAGTGGSGGSAPAECAPPVCACGSCFDDCLCDTADAEFCAESCATETPGAAGAGPDPVSGSPSGCTGAPSCDGCTSCYDACRCQYKGVQACLQQCEKSDDPEPLANQSAPAIPEPAGERPACAARVAGGPLRGEGSAWLVAAALALGRRRRNR
jgi:hypothetical protein